MLFTLVSGLFEDHLVLIFRPRMTLTSFDQNFFVKLT